MLENEFPSLKGVIAFQKPLLHEFSSPSYLLGFTKVQTHNHANVKPMHNS